MGRRHLPHLRRDELLSDPGPFGDYAAPVAATITDAQVQAFRPPMLAPPPGGFVGGFVPGDDPAHQRLRHSRYWWPVDAPAAAPPAGERLEGAFVYLGPVYDHFGHMMAEMVHRLVPSLALFGGKAKLLLVDELGAGRGPAGLPPFLRAMFGLLRIRPERIAITGRDVRVAALSICEQGSDFGGGPKAGYLPWLADAVTPRLDRLFRDARRHPKVYVSRSRHRPGGAFLGEAYLEALLAAEGFTIFHPQEHDLPLQMHVYRSADLIVFPEGSACHGTELLGGRAMGECHLLVRRDNHRDIFGRVLAPRSRGFGTFEGAIDLGSAVTADGGGEPLPYLGVSLFRSEALLAYFRGNGIAVLPTFDVRAYVTQARADLVRYAEAWGAAPGHALAPARLAEVRASLFAALDREII